MSFPSISPKQSFPALESEVLAYWKANNTFQKSIDSRPENNPYRFYDGPPFITGTPHYGSLLSSIVKDVVGRYWTMRGKRVDRVWGWDCHGLPIEEKVQKKLGLTSNREIEERGVKEFIDGCYEYTQSTSAEWDWYIDKIGRWVDMDRAYRTMDQDYMESVMWVFRQLWDKGLIYEGKRVSLYSWKLSTPISNFEVAMDDTYQEVNDPAITVRFRLEPNEKFPEGTQVLAWTTTPWTIPANMALAVRHDIDYVLVGNAGEQLIVAKNRAESVFKGKGEYAIIRELKGSELVGLGYVPPFPEYYYDKFRGNSLLIKGDVTEGQGDLVSENLRKIPPTPFVKGEPNKNHKIYHADFITDTDGTGIGHEAPEFGDVDFQLAKKEGIFISEAMDEAGKYTAQIYDYEGLHYQEANRVNIERMKENGTLFKSESITHRVPFCPRSGTPLVQKAQSSWFIDIQSQKEKLLEANKQINWFPEHLKFGRFAKGIESAPDWCISRTRYWGAPMPVWVGEGGEKVVVGSREEIFERNKPYGQLTKLILTRHAESQANVDKRYDDIGTSPLSEKGQKQAEALMQELKDQNVDVIITSPFLRAIQTAEPFARDLGIEIIIDERLKETDHGKFANGDYSNEETRKKIHEQRDAMFIDKDKKFGDTGESYSDVESRMKAVINDVCEKYPGKTVVIVSHGFPVRIATEYLTGKKASKTTHNADTRTFILDVANKCMLNLHKPYIDSVFLAPKNARKAKKVLGVHGWTSKALQKGYEGKWLPLQDMLKEEGVQFDVPDFDKEKETSYAKWRQTLETLDIERYDTIIATSFGCPVIMQYLCEKNIKLPRLVLVAPSGLKGNEYLEKIIPEMTEDTIKLRGLVEEIIITHSKDDDSTSAKFEYGKSLAEKLSCTFLPVDGVGHNFGGWSIGFLSGLIRFGSPLTRIPEVLDVWMDSGSMPYAQVHFPFAGFEDTSIRKAETNEEKESCFQFFNAIWTEEYDMSFHTRPNMSYESILDDFWKSDIFYILEGNTIISSIQLSKQTKENPFVPIGSAGLWRVATLKEFREKGLGTKLIKKALSQFVKQGEQEVYLSAEIKSIDFYKSFGFIQIQEIPEKSGNTESVYMKKTLSKADELQSLVFPADFIAEYVGQVRAWFYVMHVLGVLLNPKNEPTPTPSFTNVITTGVINGNDGRKMSKSYGNYPDPRETIEKYGADPIRFYMLNSPLLSGGDMDFKEEGIIETIKSVMLPLWNTYSFFTTYANIDGWEKDETEVWFSRHAESTSNVAGKMSDGSDNPDLTEKGREQARNAGIALREQGVSFDVIIHTGLTRAKDTAEIIGNEVGYNQEYICDTRFVEQLYGEYANKTLKQVADDLNIDVADHPKLRSFYKNNSIENISQFEERVIVAYTDILKKYRGKKILIVGHAGTSRPILHKYTGYSLEDAHYNIRIQNADPFRLMTTPIANPLDRWILSKLQVLIGKVHDAMDGYDVSRATRSIVEYMDELTNWYVRLSRRRFWGSEMTDDKKSGYETLYTVLVEVSKLLAPYMPFMAEDIFRGLTKRESVHLEYITRPNPHLIDTELNRDMELAEHIVSLGLALRSRKNIRVRQPLASITITSPLDEYYQSIIRDELNVKEVKFENPEKLAKKICKPDARKIGPKYGKDVQKVILEAKNGNFIEKENGIIDVGGFILESGEYTLEYLPLEGVGDVEGGYGIVVAMDTDITEGLKLEGYARDIIRQIQDMRKEADYQVTDRISLHISAKEGSEAGITHDLVMGILSSFSEMITHETLSLVSPLMSSPDLEKELELDQGLILKVQIEK